MIGGWTEYSSSASLYPTSTSSNCGPWNLERDCTGAAAMQDAFGFTAAQVLSISEALGIEKGKVIEALRREGIRAETFMREYEEEYIASCV